MAEHLYHQEPNEVKEMNYGYLTGFDLVPRSVRRQAAKEQQRLDSAAALVLKANRIEIDLEDHRSPSLILSALIHKGVIADRPKPELK